MQNDENAHKKLVYYINSQVIKNVRNKIKDKPKNI